MPPLTSAEIQAKIDKLDLNMDRLNEFTNGDETTVVQVDNAEVPSIAKFINDLGANLADVTTGLNVKVNTVSNGTTDYSLASPVPDVNGHIFINVYVGGVKQPKDGLAYTVVTGGTVLRLSEIPATNESIYAESATTQGTTIVELSAYDFDTKALAAAASINTSIHSVEVRGGITLGDGLGGIYIDTNTGSTDTFISSDGRTWYKTADVGRERLSGGLNAVTNTVSPIPNLELLSDSGWRVPLANPTYSDLSGRVMQGWTFDQPTAEFYTVSGEGTDFVSRVNTVIRHDRYGAVIDYSLGVGDYAYEGQVATSCATLSALSASNRYMRSRTKHLMHESVTSLKLMFANWIVNDSRVEIGSGSSITLKASIEYPAGIFTPVAFSSSSTVVIADGGTVTSDAVSVTIPENAEFWVRSHIDAPTSVLYNGNYDPAINGGARYSASPLASDGLSDSSADYPFANVYAPVGIIAQTKKPSVLIIGDSRAYGTNDTINGLHSGNIARSIGPNIAYINAGRSADRAVSWLASNTRRLTLATKVSHVILELGINDLRNGRTSANLIADVSSIITAVAKPTILTTLEPVSSSTDAWATTTNQTTDASNADRITYNTAVRNRSITGMYSYFELADIVESVRNSGLWKAGNLTGDGLHANLTGYTLEASAGAMDAFATNPNFGHAQGLESLYFNGELTLLSQNTNGNGITAAIYTGGPTPKFTNVREYILTDAGTFKHTTIGLSADKRILSTYYRKQSDGKSYVSLFEVERLLKGAVGDRRVEAIVTICLTDNPDFDGTSANNQHGQGCTSDENYIYTLNGYFQIDLPKYLYVFRISDGKLIYKKEVTSGKGKAATMGTGTTYEPEDLEWIQGGLGTAPQLWMGMRVGGAPNNNWAIPLGAYGAGLMVDDKYPLGAGIVWRAGPNDVVKFSGQAWQVSDYDDGVVTNVGGMRANNQWYGSGFRWGVTDGVELSRISATEIGWSKGTIIGGHLRKRIGVTATTLTIASDGTDSGAAYSMLPSPASSAITVNLPQDALVGHEFEIGSHGTGVCTLTATGSATINGGATKALTNSQLYTVVCLRNQGGAAAQWVTRA